MERNLSFHKGVFLLPNLLTTCSLFMGFMGMLWALNGRFEHAALAVFASVFFDGMDGRVARMTNTQSDFGVQYDSLSDLVAFGVAPAMLMYLWSINVFGRLGVMASFLFVACGALRLARFNVQATVSTRKHFIGLPIPAAACTLASLLLFAPLMPTFMAPILPGATLTMVMALSLLMVSNIRYASFKESSLFKAYPFGTMVTVVLLFVLITASPRPLSFLTIFTYVLSGPIYTFVVLARRANKMSHDKPQATRD